MKTKRLNEEEAYIHKVQNVTIDELCERFSVSKKTIRRDIDELSKNGRIIKKYGGVASNLQDFDAGLLPFHERSDWMIDAKIQIGKNAAQFIENGDYIFIDSGSTVCSLVEFISDLDITVLTNNLGFIVKAFPYPNIRIITLPGLLNRDYHCFTSIDEQSMEVMKNYNFKKAFMTASGITAEDGAMNSALANNKMKSMAVKRAQEVYLLADHTKFGNITIKSYCALEDIDVIITDEEPPKDINMVLKDKNKRVVLSI